MFRWAHTACQRYHPWAAAQLSTPTKRNQKIRSEPNLKLRYPTGKRSNNSCFHLSGSHLLEVSVHGRQRYYDAADYDGTNIGRFANQRGVLKALADVKRRSDKRVFPSFHESEWKSVNDDLDNEANACYSVNGSQLNILSKVDFGPNEDPVEIFTSYGDIRSFWISGIVREPEQYPSAMVKTVQFLFNSSASNWSTKQKIQWGNCEDLFDENGMVSTLSGYW